jgi:Ca2+-transporting ATPase
VDWKDGRDCAISGHIDGLWLGVLNNDSALETTGEEDSQKTYRIVGDPTEGSLLVAAAKAALRILRSRMRIRERTKYRLISERKRMITIHDVATPRLDDPSPFTNEKHKDWDVIAVKGAPDVVLEFCTQYQGMNDQPSLLTEVTRPAYPGGKR